MRRSPLPPRKRPLRSAAMPPGEARLRVKPATRGPLRLVVNEDELCSARVTAPCTVDRPQRAAHRHHRKRRAQGGPDTVPNLIGVCPYCHEWVHHHPELARLRGLLFRATDEITPYVPWWLTPDPDDDGGGAAA